MSAAAAFPNWVILEPFVFRRDDEESFPDDSKAPIRASGTTSWNAPFRVAFSLAEPPLISRLYAQLPGFPDPRKQKPLAILATHRHLALLRVATKTAAQVVVQDFFIYNASDADNPASIKALPPCTAPDMDYHRRDGRQPRRPRPPAEEGAPAKRRVLMVKAMGLLCRGEQGFAVVELELFKPSRFKVYADICLLRSRTSAGPEDKLEGEWEAMRVSILHSDNPDDIWQLCLWQTDTVISSDSYLCWIDYYRGILFCDVSREYPLVSFIRFPLDKFPDTHNRSRASSWLYRCVSAVDGGRALKFVNVTRDDDIGYGALKPGASFTITCHTLTLGSMVLKKDTLGSMVWNKDWTTTSDELWSANHPDRLPRDILMFPQVNIDRPHVVHFLISSFGRVMKKMWLVAIDMNTRTVESFFQYINGKEDLGTVDADLTQSRSTCPMPFLPCEFSKYLHFSRKRKVME